MSIGSIRRRCVVLEFVVNQKCIPGVAILSYCEIKSMNLF
jgi:hypothetical protein